MSGGDLPGFFAKLHEWYGDQPGLVVPNPDPHDLEGRAGVLPDAALFDLQADARTHYQAFPVYVRFVNKSGASRSAGLREATPSVRQFLDAQGQEGQVALQEPLGRGRLFVPTGRRCRSPCNSKPVDGSSHVAELRVVAVR
jgi:hypothetical protein